MGFSIGCPPKPSSSWVFLQLRFIVSILTGAKSPDNVNRWPVLPINPSGSGEKYLSQMSSPELNPHSKQWTVLRLDDSAQQTRALLQGPVASPTSAAWYPERRQSPRGRGWGVGPPWQNALEKSGAQGGVSRHSSEGQLISPNTTSSPEAPPLSTNALPASGLPGQQPQK